MLSAQARSAWCRAAQPGAELQGKRLQVGSCPGWSLWGCSFTFCCGKISFFPSLPTVIPGTWHWDTSPSRDRILRVQLSPQTKLGGVCSNPWESLGILQAYVAMEVGGQVCDALIPSQIPRGFLALNHKLVPAPLSRPTGKS